MDERAHAHMMRSSFLWFAMKVFNMVNPGTVLHPTAAFAAISHKLAEVEAGRIRRLIINVPPRYGKSVLSSIAFPAFVLGRNATRRIICASYSGELAAKLARDCRAVMHSPAYGVLFPATVISGKDTETEFETSKRGFRYSTSVGGTLTGRGGNFIIIDDPMKPDEASSALARERVWEWFTGTVGSRLDNKAEDAIIVVMQRLYVDDLAGRLLDQGGWDHLCLPAIATTEQTLDVGPNRTLNRKVGDLLDPLREPLHVLEDIKQKFGSRKFEAQYQQDPVPETGGLIQWKWFQTYDAPPRREPNDTMVISWDTAMKDGATNDYSVGIVALLKPNRHLYILDVICERFDFPSLRQRIAAETQRHRAVNLIEDAGSGTILLQEFTRMAIGAIRIAPIGDKVTRFNRASVSVEQGRVHLPVRARWFDAFKRELLSFPESSNDDQVDAFSQLVNWAFDPVRGMPLQASYLSR
jgi:predicted phage terminase large subunit-like protein